MWSIHRWYDGLREPWRFMLYCVVVLPLLPGSMFFLVYGYPRLSATAALLFLCILASRVCWVEAKLKT